MVNVSGFQESIERVEGSVVGTASASKLEVEERQNLERLLEGREVVYRDSLPYHTPAFLGQYLRAGGWVGEREEDFSGDLTDYAETGEFEAIAVARTDRELYVRAEYGPESTLRFGRLAEKIPLTNWVADNFRGVLTMKVEGSADIYDDLV